MPLAISASRVVRQDRLPDAAQPHEHEAAGRPAGLVALDRETGIGENGVAPRQLRGRRSRAGRIGIYAWVHSAASTWFMRDRHKHRRPGPQIVIASL